MKKKILLIYLAVLTIPLIALDNLDLNFSIAWKPFNSWNNSKKFWLNEEDEVKLDLDRGQYFLFWSNLKHRSGFNFGFGLNIDSGYKKNDNLVGYLSDILAYLGYENYSIRVAHGKLTGSETYTGVTDKFSGELTTVDLLMDLIPGFYFLGINYTYLSTPVILTKSNLSMKSGIAKTNLYGIVMGSDTFSLFINYDMHSIWYFWLEGWLSLGMGTAKHDKTSEKAFAWDIRTDYTLGLLIGGGKNIKYCLGLGYNVNGGLALLHHGFIMRIGMKA
jgi:hypothetical protein